MSQTINTEQIINLLKYSKSALEALYKDIMANPETKKFVIDTLKNVTTAVVAKKTLEMRASNDSTNQTTTTSMITQIQRPVITSTRDEQLMVNNHTYSGSTLRRILSRFIIASILATGMVTLFKNREQIKTKVKRVVNAMEFESVLDLLRHIVELLVNGLKTIKTKSASLFKSMLQKTKV
jgi:hypothetical protein